jgi:hypothetical protein
MVEWGAHEHGVLGERARTGRPNVMDDRGASQRDPIAARCPLCGTIMTPERAAPLRLTGPIRSIRLPGEDDLQIEAGQTVTRLRCENDHTYWLIDDADDGDGI